MSNLQPLSVDFAPYSSVDFALLPSPNSFFSAQSAFNQLPPTAAYAASPPAEQHYHSDSNSAPSPADSFDFSSLSQSSRSTSPAVSHKESPALANSVLPCNSHTLESVAEYRLQQHHNQPLAPLSLVDASAAILAASAAHKPAYEAYDYPQQHRQQSSAIQAPVARYPSAYSSQAPLSLPVAYQQVPQPGYNNVQAAYQHQQSNARTQDYGQAQQHSLAPYYQVAPEPQYQQQPQQHFVAAPAPSPFMATPSFETPQGTFYFVPNTSVQQPSTTIPVPSGVTMPMPMSMTHSRSQSSSSYDGVDESKPKIAVKKAPKKSGKNQTKRFICPHEGCGRGFARNFNMQSHLKSHLGIRDFDCPHCPKKFSRRHDRARHCAAVHDSHIPNDHARSAHHDEDEEQFEG